MLEGRPDALVGFQQSSLTITDSEFVAESGKAEHAIVKFNGRQDSRVDGVVFEVSDGELARADQDEPQGYERTSTVLASGRRRGYTLTRALDRGDHPGRIDGV